MAVQVDRHYFGDFLGYSLNVKGRLLAKGLDEGLHEFLHHMDLRQKYYYLVHNPEWHPRDLKFTITPADKDATKEVRVLSHSLAPHIPNTSETWVLNKNI